MTTRKAPDEAEIRSLLDRRARALRIKDARGVLSCQADDFVHFSLAPPLQSETDAAGLEAWFATWDGPIGYETRALAVATGEDVAFCHGLSRLTGTKIGGEKADVWFRTTLGLRKLDGAWKIVHEHESVPFYMDGSFKAAVNLKP
jgi:uncharacterized protein (TIGR02246 family)